MFGNAKSSGARSLNAWYQYLETLALVDGGVGGAGRDAGSVGVLAGPDIPDELPPLVVSLDDHLDLGVEVAVGQADHQALGGEQDTADDLEDVVGPGIARVRTHHSDQVTNAKDGHHDDQGLGTEIHSLVWMTRGVI